jgi:hypothetical protein
MPKSPELIHAVFGHFAAIPGLLSKVKSVTNDTPDRIRLPILSSAQTLQQGIREWYHRYISSDNGLNNPSIVSVSPVSDDAMFQSSYVYKDVLSASIITAYNAYLIVLNAQIDYLQPDGRYIRENLELARAICMSVDYCSHAGYCGTQTMRFSLPIAHSALPSRYHGWTKGWIEKFSSH